MAEVVWTEPALSDLDSIADYIALENPTAARKLVQRVAQKVDALADHPDLGSWPRELRGRRYRQLIAPPCRVFYRHDNGTVFILHVMRAERLLRRRRLAGPGRTLAKSGARTRQKPPPDKVTDEQ